MLLLLLILLLTSRKLRKLRDNGAQRLILAVQWLKTTHEEFNFLLIFLILESRKSLSRPHFIWLHFRVSEDHSFDSCNGQLVYFLLVFAADREKTWPCRIGSTTWESFSLPHAHFGFPPIWRALSVTFFRLRSWRPCMFCREDVIGEEPWERALDDDTNKHIIARPSRRWQPSLKMGSVRLFVLLCSVFVCFCCFCSVLGGVGSRRVLRLRNTVLMHYIVYE